MLETRQFTAMATVGTHHTAKRVPCPSTNDESSWDGHIHEDRSLDIGEKVGGLCRSQGGNPGPQLSFLMNNQKTEEPVREDDRGTLSMTPPAMRHQEHNSPAQQKTRWHQALSTPVENPGSVCPAKYILRT